MYSYKLGDQKYSPNNMSPYKLLYFPTCVLNSVTIVFLQGLHWHWMSHDGWCVIKQKNKPNLMLIEWNFYLWINCKVDNGYMC